MLAPAGIRGGLERWDTEPGSVYRGFAKQRPWAGNSLQNGSRGDMRMMELLLHGAARRALRVRPLNRQALSCA